MPALALDPPRRRQIGICGTAPTTLSLAPTDDPAWEFWCCGFPREGFKRCDRYFELHARDTFPKTGPFIDWIERGAFPVYTFDHPSSWPRGVAYPREDMLHHYGDDFFTNSISWMMALAIHELGPGGGKIGLYGVDMAMVSEYAKERAGVLHFKQVARHLGIDMVIPRASALHVKPPPYPGNCESAFARKYLERGADLDKRYEAAKAQLRALELAVAKLEGHREERDFTWMHLGIYYER